MADPLSSTDAFEWIGASGGLWSNAANWMDDTTGAYPSRIAPGALSAVTIAASSAGTRLAVAGGGLSASLGLAGKLALDGAYATGDLALGSFAVGRSSSDLLGSVDLTLGADANLTAAKAYFYSGLVTLDQPGVALTVAGRFGMGAPDGAGILVDGRGGGQCLNGWAALTLGAGAKFSSGDFALNHGALTLNGAGAVMTVGALTLGETPPDSYRLPDWELCFPFQGYATVMVAAGAQLAVGGGLTLDSGSALAVVGAGSTLTVAGSALIGAEPFTASIAANDIAATSGGAISFGDTLSFARLTDYCGATPVLHILVDGRSSIVIGAGQPATAGALTVAAGARLVDGLDVEIVAAIVNQGDIEVSGALTLDGALSGAGTVTLDAGATVRLHGDAGAAQRLAFDGVGARLDIGAASDGTLFAVRSTISGFAIGDDVQLDGVAATSASYSAQDGMTGELIVRAGAVELERLTLVGDYSMMDFVVSNVAGGSEISLQSHCFWAGTRIATAGGEAAIESLAVGDLARDADGALKPIRWIGRQTVARGFSDPLRQWPIRVRAEALGEGVPRRDLLLSPEHGLLVGGVLVQAGALVNGRSILRETNVPEKFVYYHVELADHALILAENAPAESFIGAAQRLNFDNWAEHGALGADGEPIDELPLPRVRAARQVPRAVQRALLARAEALFAPRAAA